jgi:hypothetical protein
LRKHAIRGRIPRGRVVVVESTESGGVADDERSSKYHTRRTGVEPPLSGRDVVLLSPTSQNRVLSA